MPEIIVQSQYKRCDSEAIGKYILKTAKRKKLQSFCNYFNNNRGFAYNSSSNTSFSTDDKLYNDNILRFCDYNL